MLSCSLVLACLACLLGARASVLAPTYALPPSSFVRDQRSLQGATRTLARLAGGHIKLHPTEPDHAKNAFASLDKDTDRKNNLVQADKDAYDRKHAQHKESDHSKNTFAPLAKDAESYDRKYAGVIVKQEGHNVGWNQGQWDDGMLMSSAGDGKQKQKEEDEDKKTLSDQVAEGKYGLIQKELFLEAPTRPGVVSYAANPETHNRDNEKTLGGLKGDDVWLAEDHLLVLRGGALPEHGARPGTEGAEWPPIDDYTAPRRPVKVPAQPQVPPPFPVRLQDGGPLVFLTPNGSVPAPLLPPGAGHGAVPPEAFGFAPYPPPGPPPGAYKGDLAPGRAPFPPPPFPFLPGNGSNIPFPFPFPFPGPPPPRGNLTDLYDEDDPSIYYPPPYSFSYNADNGSSPVAAGPLVPGIVLPPPPDFFAPEKDEPVTTARPTAHAYPPTSGAPPTAVLRPRPHKPAPAYLPSSKPETIVSDSPDNSIDIVSTPPTKVVTFAPRPVYKKPTKVVVIPKPSPPRKIITTTAPVQTNPTTPAKPVVEKKRPSVTIVQKPIKTTLKPVSGSLYDYPEKNYFEGNSVSPSPQPFVVYGPPESARLQQYPEKAFVSSTPVPLRAYYSDSNYENILSQIQYTRQNTPNTRIRPEFYSPKQNGKSVASFYFYEEPVTKTAATTPPPQTFYDDRNYYQTVGQNEQQVSQQDGYYYNQGSQTNFVPSNNFDLRPIPSREPSPFFYVPQRQGSRTLTQEYFSINQNPKSQANYVQQQPIQQQLQQQPARPSTFFDQIANIQQTIDYYTTHRPKVHLYQQNPYREVRQKPRPTPRPVYQFSFQNNNPRPEQNTFRAPKLDPEPFRPMVSYSKPYNIEPEYSTTPGSNVVVENQVLSTEISQPSKYYTTAKPEDYDYNDASQKQNVERATSKPLPVTQNSIIQKPQRLRGSGPTTKSPVNHAYYTKQEESLFDDITKNYFTIFGQKIENGNRDSQGLAVTTPLRPVEVSTVKTPINNNINIQYANEEETNTFRPEQKPISLAGDTDVNYRQPRPLINPESEFIPIVNPEIQAKYEAERQLQQIRDQIYQKQRTHSVEIIKSEAINPPIREGHQFARDQLEYYRRPIQGSQTIQSPHREVNGVYNQRPQVAEGRPGSLIAYRLPGEGAHVYFLTPQPARPENFKYRTAEEIASLS